VIDPKHNLVPDEFGSFVRSVRQLGVLWLSIPVNFGHEPKWFVITVCGAGAEKAGEQPRGVLLDGCVSQVCGTHRGPPVCTSG
jgi:hypothetical protein